MAAFDAEVLDVGGACLTHSQPVQTEEHCQGGVVAVVLLGGEQEHAELGAVESSPGRGVNLWPTDVLRGVGSDSSIDVGEAIEAADGREATVDRRRREPPVFHPASDDEVVPRRLDCPRCRLDRGHGCSSSSRENQPTPPAQPALGGSRATTDRAYVGALGGPSPCDSGSRPRGDSVSGPRRLQERCRSDP
jgi:hypothetical protein